MKDYSHQLPARGETYASMIAGNIHGRKYKGGHQKDNEKRDDNKGQGC